MSDVISFVVRMRNTDTEEGKHLANKLAKEFDDRVESVELFGRDINDLLVLRHDHELIGGWIGKAVDIEQAKWRK